jgi:hypothetical protein
VEIVTTDDGGCIPAQYQPFVNVFSKEKSKRLPLYRPIDHVINLKPDYNLRYRKTNNISEFTLKMLKTYIEMNLAHGNIQ